MNTDKIYAEAIANEYSPKDASKVVALKKLDYKAKLPANIFAFSFGTIMALILGTGMCLSMKVIGNGSTAMMVVGIIVGIIGIVGVGVNYPIKLLAEKDIMFISVKEICERAGVNRSTFYLHYETIGDLLEETTEYIVSKFLASFEKTEGLFGEDFENVPLNDLVFINEKYLKPYLQFIYENRSVFKAAIHNPVSMKADKMYSGMKKHVLEPVMQRFNIPKDEQNYWMAFYFRGIWAVIQEWIDDGCNEPIEKIESIIEKCVFNEKVLHE